MRDAEGKPAGTLQDVVVSTRQKYPRVTALVVKRGNRRAGAPWDAVASLEESGVLLRVAGADARRARARSADELLLSGQVLDRQIVDTDGRKMIRVNDIQLAALGPVAARRGRRRLERRHPAAHRPRRA